MTAKFKMDRGSPRVIDKLIGLDNLLKQGIRQGMFDSGHDLINSASKEILRKPKSGRTYIVRSRTGRRRRHVASAPGETHANRSGAARQSLSFQLQGAASFEFGYGVSSGKVAPEYVEFLEFGTSKMEPRPSLQNAIKDRNQKIIQNVEREIAKKLK